MLGSLSASWCSVHCAAAHHQVSPHPLERTPTSILLSFMGCMCCVAMALIMQAFPTTVRAMWALVRMNKIMYFFCFVSLLCLFLSALVSTRTALGRRKTRKFSVARKFHTPKDVLWQRGKLCVATKWINYPSSPALAIAPLPKAAMVTCSIPAVSSAWKKPDSMQTFIQLTQATSFCSHTMQTGNTSLDGWKVRFFSLTLSFMDELWSHAKIRTSYVCQEWGLCGTYPWQSIQHFQKRKFAHLFGNST